MDEYNPCQKADPTAREAIGNIMRLVQMFLHMMRETDIIFREVR